ncbi:MarR family winged helix-turn-helix transcriptional regulator [Nocardia neocaledoniensis]|uniref:MarR family winged helix-turn-helix transcriptional regulator n=1 Tax=Nocardia neocaledoniensis TaxID=236511 RepID=UPI002455366D|nr:MarR family transcriptional regulator [Nocardia neocaledoniensis]
MHLLAAGNQSPVHAQQLKQMTGYDITLRDQAVLRLICLPDPVTVSQVARQLGVNLPRASCQLTKLVDLGLAERSTCSVDGRNARTRATAEGRRISLAWRGLWIRDYFNALASWGPEEITEFGDMLQRMRRHYGAGPLPIDDLDVEATELNAPGGDPARLSALRHTIPLLVNSVNWATSAANGPANTRRILAVSESPVAARPVMALRLILRHGPLDVTELAVRAGLAVSQASRTVTELERHRLVERWADAVDGRRSRLTATARGTALIRRINDCEYAPIAAAMTTWASDEVRSYLDYYRRLLAHFLELAESRAAVSDFAHDAT